MFFKGSRYENVEDDQITTADGRVIRFKKVRFIRESRPQGGYLVRQGDRLDLIAQIQYRDPERFWRICDLNRALWPDDLVAEPGRLIGIPPAQD
jgi:hypothetical protein